MRILILRAVHLGDLIFASSVIPLLHANFGKEIQLDWVGKQQFAEFTTLDPAINNYFALKSSSKPLACSPCWGTNRITQCLKNLCLTTIKPAEVMQKITEVLQLNTHQQTEPA